MPETTKQPEPTDIATVDPARTPPPARCTASARHSAASVRHRLDRSRHAHVGNALLAAMLGVILAAPVALGQQATAEPVAKPAAAPSDVIADPNPNVGPRALSRAFRLAARRAMPSVVTVYTYGQNSTAPASDDEATDEESPAEPEDQLGDEEIGPKPPAKTDDELKLTGLGSGAIISSDGLVITNNHVVRNAKRVKIQMPDETEFVAVVVHGDPASDVAILRIESDEPLPALELGDSSQLEIGDWVLAIGSPFKLEATVSAGIISAKNRKLEQIKRGRLLQTDAAINPGNSGGPLIDLDGRMVGISTAIATRSGGYQGIGFVIPVNQAKWIAEELDKFGKVRRAAIGVTLAELNARIAKMYKLPVGLGLLAYQVIADSAAEKAGIKNGDVITKFAGERVRNKLTLQQIVERTPVGSTQSITISRDGKTIELEITLATTEDPTSPE